MFRSLFEIIIARRHSQEIWNPASALLGRDRRIFQRVPLTLPCRLVNPGFGLESEAMVINMSLGGAGVVAPVTWPEGGQVRFVLQDFSAEALIVFRQESPKQFRYGVKFKDLSFLGLWRLRKILKSHYAGPLAV